MKLNLKAFAAYGNYTFPILRKLYGGLSERNAISSANELWLYKKMNAILVNARKQASMEDPSLRDHF
jgi:hypothetical protein